MHTLFQTTTLALLTMLMVPGRLLALEAGVLSNPLPRITGIDGLLFALVNMVQIIAVPFIVGFIIYSGFLFVTARGNQETLTQAKKALLYSVIGGVVVIGAELIGMIITNTAGELTE
jgi:hypothetical protein